MTYWLMDRDDWIADLGTDDMLRQLEKVAPEFFTDDDSEIENKQLLVAALRKVGLNEEADAAEKGNPPFIITDGIMYEDD